MATASATKPNVEDRILAATLAIIGERGLEAVTHRAVAERAGASLGAISHHFPSRSDLLQEALRRAAAGEVSHLERLALELQSRAFATDEWVRSMAEALGADLRRNRTRHLAQYELLLACSRDPRMRELSRAWREAHVRVAEVGLRAAGSRNSALHAQLLTAAITGILLKQLAYPVRGFTDEVLQPQLQELVTALVTK
jgi:TetR/AcrR family transcriptional regulator, regulator of biofilm formation and stress response